MTSVVESPSCDMCLFAFRAGDKLECREGPPAVHLLFEPDGAGGMKAAGTLSVFPSVRREMSCGRWRQAVAEIMPSPAVPAIHPNFIAAVVAAVREDMARKPSAP